MNPTETKKIPPHVVVVCSILYTSAQKRRSIRDRSQTRFRTSASGGMFVFDGEARNWKAGLRGTWSTSSASRERRL
jgi:hypothetical protein